MADRRLKDLRVADLKVELEKRSLPTGGVKAILVERLQNFLQEQGQNPEEYVFGEDIEPVRKEDDEPAANDEKPEEEKADENVSNGPNNINEANNQPAAEEDSINIMIGEEEVDFDEEPSEKSNGPVSSPPRPENVPVVRPFTSKDTINMHSNTNKAHSENSSMFVHFEEESVGGDKEGAETKVDGEDTKNKKENEDTTSPIKTNCLWVSNLSALTKAEALREKIKLDQGSVVSVRILTKSNSSAGRSYALVELDSAETASQCIDSLKEIEIDGKILHTTHTKADPSTIRKKKRPLAERLGPVDHQRSLSSSDKKPPRRRISPPPTKILDARERIRGNTDGQRRYQNQNSYHEDRRQQRSTSRTARTQHHHSSTSSRSHLDDGRRRDVHRREELDDRRRPSLMDRPVRRPVGEEERLQREREELRREREKLEREKQEILRFERERQRLERERLEREKQELERLKMQQMDRMGDYRKRPANSNRDPYYDDRKRSAPMPSSSSSNYEQSSSSSSRYGSAPNSNSGRGYSSSGDRGGNRNYDHSRRVDLYSRSDRSGVTSSSSSSSHHRPGWSSSGGDWSRGSGSSQSGRHHHNNMSMGSSSGGGNSYEGRSSSNNSGFGHQQSSSSSSSYRSSERFDAYRNPLMNPKRY